MRRDGSRRLVEQEHLAVECERLSGFHQLHLRCAQVRHHLAGRDLQPHDVQPLLRFLLDLPVVHKGPRLHRHLLQQDVFADGEAGNEIALLRHNADACLDGCPRRMKLHRLTEHLHLAGIRLVQPGDDLDQRALARAVFADERVNLARAQRQRDVVKRQNTREGFADAADFQGDMIQLFGHATPPFPPPVCRWARRFKATAASISSPSRNWT